MVKKPLRREKERFRAEEIVKIIAEAAEQKKAREIRVINLIEATVLFNYFIICSGQTIPQIKAISEGISQKLSEIGIKSIRWEGLILSKWVILDCGDVVVHVMGEEERKYYNLEELWSKASIVYHF